MTNIAALIPRTRFHRDGRAVAVRCPSCRTWRKPRHINRDSGTCRYCPTGRLGRYLTTCNRKRH